MFYWTFDQIEDPTGIELASERQAGEVASEIAKQIAVDEDDNDMKVVVKTSDGEVVHKTPIKSVSTP